MPELLYYGDIALFTRINQEWTTLWLDSPMRLFSSVPLLWALLIVTMTILVRRCWRKCSKPLERGLHLKKILAACLLLACSAAITDGTTYAIKYCSNRQRPYHVLAGARYPEGSQWVRRPIDAPLRKKRGSSFVSGHASNSMALAVTLGHLCPPLKPFIYILPACVGYSRIYLGRHYPSDVAGGWFLGWLLSSCVCRAFQWRISRPRGMAFFRKEIHLAGTRQRTYYGLPAVRWMRKRPFAHTIAESRNQTRAAGQRKAA